MSLEDVLLQMFGVVAFALNVWGNLALTKKGTKGWVIRLVCNGFWVPYSVYTSAWALLANHVVFAGINIYGWYKWTKEEKQKLVQ